MLLFIGFINFIEERPVIVRELSEIIFNIDYFLYSFFTDYQHGFLIQKLYSVDNLARFS